MTAFSKAILADLIVGLLTADRVIVTDPDAPANRVFIDPDLFGTNRPLILLEAAGSQADAGAEIASADALSFGNGRPYLILKSPTSIAEGFMTVTISDNETFIYGADVLNTYLLQIGRSGLGTVDMVIIGAGDLTMGTGLFSMNGGNVSLDGNTNRARAAGMTPIESASVTNDNVTSTTYVHGPNGVSVVFVAPPSGVVRVDCFTHVLVRPATDVRRVIYGTYELRTGAVVGSGTVVSAANDEWAIQTESLLSTFRARTSGTFHVHETGLTPGAAYHVRTMHRIDTATVAEAIDAGRRLTVTPCL